VAGLRRGLSRTAESLRRPTAAIALLLCLSAPAALPGQAAARRSVPPGFVGMVVEGPVLDPQVANLPHEMDLMVHSGVESIRAVFPWAGAQPYPNWDSVPPDKRQLFRDENGVPTAFGYSDRIVAVAAQRGLAVLPVLWQAPRWAAREPGGDEASPPRSADDFAQYAAALVDRYGPNGSLWAEYPALPRVPIRSWQIWNEPNIVPFWKDQPFAPDYVAVLRAARARILALDPGARIVIGGLVNDSWNALRKVYDAGGQGLFDVMAVHPFTRKVGGVITILRRVRKVMAAHGDGAKPLAVTELSWPSAVGKVPRRELRGFEVTPQEQARRVREGFALLAHWRHRLRIVQVDWYSWLRFDQFRTETFDYAGLRHITSNHTIEDKPAAGTFKKEALKLEGCRRKGPKITDCKRS
jgi:hypothetical protein